jgi:DME family drug/metabolite transporter
MDNGEKRGAVATRKVSLDIVEELLNNSRMSRLLVLLAAICFATTGTAQELGPEIEPVAVGAARIAVGGALLTVVAWWLRRRRSPASTPSARMAPAVLGAIAVAVAAYQLSFFAAVHRTGVAVGTVVALGSAPAFAGLAGRLAGDAPLGRRWALSTALACAGVGMLVLAGGSAQIDPLGVALALVSGSGYATYTVASKRLLAAGHAPETVMACGFGAAALLLAPVLVLAGGAALLTPGGVALALYLGAVPTALAYVLFARGLRRLSAGETATLTLAEPVTAAALGVLVLGEHLGGLAAIGAAVTLAGLVVLALPAPRSAARLAPVPAR